MGESAERLITIHNSAALLTMLPSVTKRSGTLLNDLRPQLHTVRPFIRRIADYTLTMHRVDCIVLT